MKLDLEKLEEIYGKNLLIEFKENIEDVKENIIFLNKFEIDNLYEIVELYPYLFLISSDIFQEKIKEFICNLGIEYKTILEEDTTLWGGIEID